MQAQYNFIHDALNELILCGDTEITASNLRIAINRLSKIKDGETGYSKQFNVSWSELIKVKWCDVNFLPQILDHMTLRTSESDYTQANMECNVSKNRCYPNNLPSKSFK